MKRRLRPEPASRRDHPLSLVRPVLLLMMVVLGAYLGRYLGETYVKLSAVERLIGENQTYVSLSRYGFIAIGLLLGFYAFRWLSNLTAEVADRLREQEAPQKIAVVIGAVLGLLLTVLLYPILMGQFKEPELRVLVGVGLAALLVSLSTQGMLSMTDEIRRWMPRSRADDETEEGKLRNPKILDTNIIIDGRISAVQRSGFIEGDLYVPGFVLDELQLIADSADAVKRARGRRGLDLLNSMQKEFHLTAGSMDHLAQRESHEGVDQRLIRLAAAMKGSIVTNDFNLNKVAELRGVKVLNINELASSLKPVVLPGEDLTVYVQKEGREPGQGIAYLDDGTMVVVEGGRRQIGETIDVTVTSVLQNVSGKMIFSEVASTAQNQSDQVDRNLRNYSPRRRGGKGESGTEGQE